MNIRKACLIILFLAVSICNPCLNVNMVGAQSTALEPVTIQLRWFHQFQFAGYYAAIEKGFYAEEGLRVSLREFEPGKDRIAPVLEGKAQYGVGDPSLLKLRLLGQPLVVLAQIFQHSPSVLITRRESGVFSPEELAGHDYTRSTAFERGFVIEGLTTYYGDYWDCSTCDNSKEPTEAQNKKLIKFLSEPEYRARFTS